MPGHHIQIPDAGTDSASHFGVNHPQAANINLRNPLPLSAAQEAQVKDLYYKRVRRLCDPEIKAFAECARGRTITATWTCRETRHAMNSCMVLHANPENEDAAREEWFKGIQERRRKREETEREVEKRRVEVIELTRRKAEQEAEEKARLAEGEKKKGWW